MTSCHMHETSIDHTVAMEIGAVAIILVDDITTTVEAGEIMVDEEVDGTFLAAALGEGGELQPEWGAFLPWDEAAVVV